MFLAPLTTETATARLNEFKVNYPKAAAASNGRAERAAHMVAIAGLVETTDQPGIYFVRSESNPLGAYTVNTIEKSCTCPDHGKHSPAGAVCKHRLTVAYLTHFGKAKPQPQPPTLLEQIRAAKRDQWAVSDSVWITGEPRKPGSIYLHNDDCFIRLYVMGQSRYMHPVTIWYLSTDGWTETPWLDLKFKEWEFAAAQYIK